MPTINEALNDALKANSEAIEAHRKVVNDAVEKSLPDAADELDPVMLVPEGLDSDIRQLINEYKYPIFQNMLLQWQTCRWLSRLCDRLAPEPPGDDSPSDTP